MAMKKWALFYLFFSFILISNSIGQEKNLFNNNSLGVEFGAWKPNNLQNSKSPIKFKPSKENLYIGALFLSPLKNSLYLRTTIGYYYYVENSEDQKSIVLLPILFDIKYMLVSGSKISPYVSYGIGTCIGHQNNSDGLNNDKFGFSANLGTGFDFLISKHIALGLEFRYHYLKFSKVFVFTDDYSGLKINLTLYYLF